MKEEKNISPTEGGGGGRVQLRALFARQMPVICVERCGFVANVPAQERMHLHRAAGSFWQTLAANQHEMNRDGRIALPG